MGNQGIKSAKQIDNEEWEIIVEHPCALEFSETSDFEIIQGNEKQPQPLFKTPIKVITNKQKKYIISKKIKDLQDQIGGEYLFGPRQNMIQTQQEAKNTHLEIIFDRPAQTKSRPRKVKTNNFQFY